MELSTKHGILTPYTSFLADDTMRPLLSGVDGVRRAHSSLKKLDEASGLGGVAQRSAKGAFQNALNAAAPNPGFAPVAESKSPSDLSASTASRVRRNEKVGSAAINPASGSNSYRDIETDKLVSADSVRQYGSRAVYSRSQAGKSEQILVTPETAELDLDRDKDKIEIVDRFSEPYFALIQANTATENQILSQQRDGEHLLIKLRGKNFLIK